MSADWIKGYDPNQLAHRLERAKRLRSQTNDISFEGFVFDEVVTVLHSSIDFSEELAEPTKRELIHSAIVSTGRSGTISAKRLIEEVRSQEHSFLATPKARFVVCTNMSIKYVPSLTRKEILGNRITFSKYLPQHFLSEHERARSMGDDALFGRLPKVSAVGIGYEPVRVSVHARNFYEAVEEGLDSIDLLRGIWNFGYHTDRGVRSSSGRRKPPNRIVLGPVHSLHNPNGSLATPVPWIEPDYVEALWPYHLQQIWHDIEGFEREVRKQLARSNYGQDLQDTLLRYTRALDKRDWNSAFLQLWGLLEFITDTSRERYEVTVQRVLFLIRSSERPFHRQILRHLMNYRNRTVHAGHEADTVETLLYQLKRYVEIVMRFHLWPPHRFSSLKEAAKFLDLPAEIPDLKDRATMTRLALGMQS